MTTNSKPQAETPVSGFTHAVRDLISVQIRTAQFILDKSFGIGQNIADFYQTQVTEAVKLSQECTKASWAVTENIKNNAIECTDRVVRGFSV